MTAFLSTPSARRATRSFSSLRSAQRDFYPRPPRGGRRSCCARSSRGGRFLSTPSARRATSASPAPSTHPSDFYPRPPRGGRRISSSVLACLPKFLSTPSARRATRSPAPDAPAAVFLSTPSARRATDSWCRTSQRGTISIHALREEGDRQPCRQSMRWNDFYPRPPRGGRPHRTCRATTAVLFLSTPSARRATGFCKVLYWSKEFLSTPSARRATQLHPHPDNPRKISIHALREEGDGSGQFVLDCVYLFLSTPSARRAT